MLQHFISLLRLTKVMRASLSSVALRAAARQGRGSRRRRHGRRRSRDRQVGRESRSLQDLIFGIDPALQHASTGGAGSGVRHVPVSASTDMPVLPPHRHSSDDTMHGMPILPTDSRAFVEKNNIKPHSSSPLLASAPFEDEALKESAQAIRELILSTPKSDKHLIASEFAIRYPSHSKTIKHYGGIKAVSKLLPHMYTFGRGGALTAPPLGPARDELMQVAKNTHVRTLCDAFVLAGGTTAPMSLFEREQVDDDGACIPQAVAIDTEGIHLIPPILVQVCPVSVAVDGDSSSNTSAHTNKVYIEQPRRRAAYGGGSQLSDALKDLLADESVLKVFFDAKGDIASLGTPVNSVLCLQNEARGLSLGHGKKITPSLMDMFNECSNGSTSLIDSDVKTTHRILYSKNKAMTKWFQNKRRPTKRIHDNLEIYGAADAWATARIYEYFVLRSKDEEEETDEAGSDGLGDGPIESTASGTNDQRGQRCMTSAEIRAELKQRAEKLMMRNMANDSNGVEEESRDKREASLSLMERLGQYIKSFGA